MALPKLLLLRYAGADEDLRTPRTLEAIERLAERRLVEQTVARDRGRRPCSSPT